MDRRSFCLSLVALPTMMSAASAQARLEIPSGSVPAVWDHFKKIRFVLHDPLEHPFYWWPRTLLSYPIEFHSSIELNHLVLTRIDTGDRVPIQFSEVVNDSSGLHSATLHFFSDLPSGGHREFELSAVDAAIVNEPLVKEVHEGDTITLDSGVMRIRIPATQVVQGDAPGPILQVSRGGAWVGTSTLSISNDPVARITADRIADGPLFIAYKLTYETKDGSRYVAKIQCNGGLDFVRFQEDMEGLKPDAHGAITSTWGGFNVTHRQAPNHPYPSSGVIHNYDDYPWEKVGEPWVVHPEPLPDGELPFALGIYQTWTALRTGTFGNFWDRQSGDALGVFIDKTDDWQDHEYANHVESPTLQVRYFYQNGKLLWKWPIARGSRSTCIAFYDHSKDKEAMHRLEEEAHGITQDGLTYQCGLIYTSYAQFLQGRYGTLDLNCVKDWVLDYPAESRHPAVLFPDEKTTSPDDLERRIMAGSYVCTLPVNGTRQNGGAGPTPGKGIVNFSPVPSRQVLGWWVIDFNRCRSAMSERQRARLTAMYLFMAYIHAGDDFMPLVPMISGHPNFLADVKAVPPAMSFLFPDHPMASTWADMWQKCVEMNTRYNTRPDVKTWGATGGRWTENLGTYVWAFLRPSLRTDFLVRQYDRSERFVTPQLAEVCDWLVNALSAPFNGETAEAYHALQKLDDGHEWGALEQGEGPRRVHPPQGAHSEERVPPRSLWYFGTCLKRYAPLAAEHAMWAARPTNQDMETSLVAPDAWQVMFDGPDNHGTNPHLRSRKFTGYGIVLRSAVDTPDELSIHLQQIDEGPNYRWGIAGEGGCGVIYFFAAGKCFSFNGAEDVGDRSVQDTDFCTNFGVFKDGEFRSIGQNVLSRPFYDLGVGQFAEILPREGAGAYSAPEYLGRSVLLAGHDYFVLYDSVLNQSIVRRLSWSVRRGSEFPTFKFVRGISTARETQRTEIQSAGSTGIWFDGSGDSMVVVSHRKDIQTETKPFGCHVSAPGIDDLVFRNPDPIQYADGATLFDGTSGLIRTRNDKTELALFHGTKIGVPGIAFSTTDTDLGIGAAISPGQPVSGDYFAPKASSLKIVMPNISEKTMFYVDGEARTARRESGAMFIELEAGHHHWELTDQLPVPVAPRILRTENKAGGARVIIAPAHSATAYHVELSKDNGATWTKIDSPKEPELTLTGLSNGEKVHVRAIAFNALHESAPGPEYPLYVTNDAPPPPEGLHVDLENGAATISWGDVLGVSEYRLYARFAGDSKSHLIYRGLDRAYQDKQPGIRSCLPNPNDPGDAVHANIVEYHVTAANGNGEGPPSRWADTNPAGWRNWDPKPGEPFSRAFDDYAASTSIRVPTEWPRHYPE